MYGEPVEHSLKVLIDEINESFKQGEDLKTLMNLFWYGEKMCREFIKNNC